MEVPSTETPLGLPGYSPSDRQHGISRTTKNPLFGSANWDIDIVGCKLYPSTGTVDTVFFRLNPAAGQPLYAQLMDQIRHAAETGLLQDGDQLPGIRTLAEELVVSANTVVKAYTELENEGLLELRQGAGAFVTLNSRTRRLTDRMQAARNQARELIDQLRDDGLRDEEIRRAFEAELLHSSEIARKR